MEGLGMKRVWADFRFQDHLNSRPDLHPDNRHVVAQGYQSLDLCYNTPAYPGDRPEVPQNILSAESFSQGWGGAFRPEEKPWL